MATTSLDLILGETVIAEPGDGFVLLQQESWDPYIGQLTKMQAVSWLSKIIFQARSPLPNCPPDMPGFSKSVYGFPSHPSLVFSAGVSNGQLVRGPVETVEFSELLQVGLSRRPTLKYPAIKITSHSWEGDVYSKLGERINPPQVRVVDYGLEVSGEVYGSLRVSYLVYRYAYTVLIEPRAEYQERKLQSFFYAAWKGGIAHIEIEAPMGTQPEEIPCNNQWQTGVGQYDPILNGLAGGMTAGDSGFEDGDDPYRPVSGEDVNEYVDYCSQEVI